MEWIILFAVSWILFFTLVDWSKLGKNVWSGLLAVTCQLYVDTSSIRHKFYRIEDAVLSVWGSSAFFVLGPVLVVGILIAQYHPKKKWMTVFYILGLSGLYSLQEYFLVIRQAVVYLDWHFHESLAVNTAVMVLLSWFSVVILNRGDGIRK